jgi:CRISPR-associated endonuclease/helicase Cas3
MTSVRDVLSFWGKAQPEEGSRESYHPIALHQLDVAAVANAMLETRPTSRARAAALLGLGEDEAHRLLVALVALHDLGKFTPYFQSKAPDCWPAALGELTGRWTTACRHTDDGYLLWRDVLAKLLIPRLWPDGEETIGILAPGLFGHHGRPIASGTLDDRRAKWRFVPESLAAAIRCGELTIDLLLPDAIAAAPPTEERANSASWWIAGFITTADWIGSRVRWFPYGGDGSFARSDDEGALAQYWDYAKDRARAAVRHEGIGSHESSTLRSLRDLTGIECASPLQAWAEETPLPDGPILVVIEDATGSGKTEAAQMIVHRLIASGRASGAYWAMPTQATANAMYGRHVGALEKLYSPSGRDRPSLILAHGQSRLHAGFSATVLASSDAEAQRELSDEEGTSSAACSAFFADDRRAALLADLGIGTIDQAVLGVLPSKFNTMRLFGLSEKVLVVDEAHAYDAYVSVELEQLLRFHSALGGSAIVLSATLSEKQRASIVRAWQEGLKGGTRRILPPTLESKGGRSAYPLATIVASSDVVIETPVGVARRSCRTIPVRFVHSVDNALEHLVAAAEAGAAVAWVRNTVRDCLAAATMLRARGIEPIVFHARFAQGDRQRREAEVMALFGKKSTPELRRGRVLIATQVVEQSLDLDFDAMVSDIAPIDLLIQRAGRLWRHEERDPLRPHVARELVVLTPEIGESPPADWITALLPGTARVYENANVLWRTARVLAEKGEIDCPSGLRELVESVYGSEEVADSLAPATGRALGNELAKGLTAAYATLRVGDGYQGDAAGWLDERHAVTRLSDRQTIVARLARGDDGGNITPWEPEGGPSWKVWALSEVRVDASRFPEGFQIARKYREAVEALRATWPEYERRVPVLPLILDAEGEWRGSIQPAKSGEPKWVAYSRRDGLRFE